MNNNLNDAIVDIAKADALMYAIENTYLGAIDVEPEDKELYNRGVSAFYAVWDVIHKVSDDLERLSGDYTVVDVIRATRGYRENLNK